MTRKFTGLLTLVLVVPVSLAAQDAKPVLQVASKAIGDVRSIQYSGTGHLYALGQAYSPTSAWPQNNITSYTRTIDYGSRSSREELTQVEPTPPRLGGAAPFAGEQKQINLVSGQYGWNQVGNAPQPAVAAAEERQLQIWLTPHGFLKAAMLMVRQGANAFLIRQHLGHRSFDSTLAYVNPSDADASAAAAKAFSQVF
jgi:hypothetical protein